MAPARTLAGRLVALQVLLIIGLLSLVTIVHAFAGFVLYARALDRVAADVAGHIASAIDRGNAEGVSAQEAAEQANADLPDEVRPTIRILVYDENGRLIAGEPVGERSVFDRLFEDFAGIAGLRGAAAAFEGGSVRVLVSTERYREQLFLYLAETLPFGVIALIIAVAGGRAIATQAVTPLIDVTVRLRALASGDFTPRPVATAARDEIGELARAYNDAVVQVQSAFARRDQAELKVRQFVADAGHELRTPLTVVMGYMDALKDGIVTEPQKVARVYAVIADECLRMRATIRQLIYLTRLDADEKPAETPVDLVDLVDEITAVLQPLIPTLEVSLPPEDVRVMVLADRGELREAISNVLDNALKYAGETLIRCSLSAEDRTAIVEVTDHGAGMSEEDVAHVFDRFHRGSDRGEIEGSGLGLSIVKRSIERIGGQVTLASRLGQGTTVTIRLPLAAEAISFTK
ncbi:MAG TPA: HAMP domain-containing sensor histidine kinase [Candidatus Baltobacteraceae bacterium]|jgi:two-component system OmpR family sensor kinase|nr:HAMP domain-containing sensor histidine kinase [Candidatus Baltobacteraceae bacterium]